MACAREFGNDFAQFICYKKLCEMNERLLHDNVSNDFSPIFCEQSFVSLFQLLLILAFFFSFTEKLLNRKYRLYSITAEVVAK